MRTGYHSGMIIAVVDDLMFASKIRSAAEHAGIEIAFVRSPDAVVADVTAKRPSLVIFDLDREHLDPVGSIRSIRSHPDLNSTRLIAYVRHTSTDLIEAAREAGIDQVLARSAFVGALPAMFASAGVPGSGPEPSDKA